MGSFIDISKKEVLSILTHYGIDHVHEIIPSGHGTSNSNYKVVTNEGPILLKVSNDKNLDELADEMEILLYLKKKKFPYSLVPLPQENGELIYHVPPYFGVIFPFIEGSAPKVNKKNCFKIGQGLGKLHQITDGKKLPPTIRHHRSIADGSHAIKDFAENDPNCPKYYKDLYHEVFPTGVDHYFNKTFPEGIIHGDLYYDNAFFQNDKLSIFLDFEQAGIGKFIFDFGVATSGTCLDSKGNIDCQLLAEYQKGYESIRHFKPLEKQYLPMALCLGLFSISLWRIRRFYFGNLDPSRKESYKELINRALNYKKFCIG